MAMNSSLNQFFLSIFIILITLNSPVKTTSRMLRAETNGGFDTGALGSYTAHLMKVFHFASVVLLLYDVFSRFKNKSKRMMPIWRLSVFSFSVSMIWLISQHKGYREFNGPFLEKYFTSTMRGYFGSGVFSFFEPIKGELLQDYPDYVHYWNAIFFESLLYIPVKILSLCYRKDLLKMKKSAHLIFSMKAVLWFGFMPTFLGQAFLFYKQEYTIIKLQYYDRSTLGVIMAWVILIFMSYEGFSNLSEMLDILKQWKRNLIDRRMRVKIVMSNNILRKKRRRRKKKKLDKREGFSYYDIVCELALGPMMAQHAIKINSALYFNYIWTMRWLCFAFFSILASEVPKTIYFCFSLINILMLLNTIKTSKYLLPQARLLIIIQESLVCLWHICQFILFIDEIYPYGMKAGFAWMFVILIFVSFIGCLIIEIALFFVFLKYKDPGIDLSEYKIDEKKLLQNESDEITQSEELQISIPGEMDERSDVHQKLKHYNTLVLDTDNFTVKGSSNSNSQSIKDKKKKNKKEGFQMAI